MLFDRIKNQNASAYLTLMSIIQGVALSFFAFAVTNNYQTFGTANWILVLCTFVLLILTWFEYIVGVSIFTWLHGLSDSIIPFLLFAAEVMLIQTMSKSDGHWYFSMVVFCAASILAFVNMYVKASTLNENASLLQSLRCWRLFNLAFISLSAVVYMLLYWCWQPNREILFSSLALAFISIFAISAELYWLAVLQHAKNNA